MAGDVLIVDDSRTMRQIIRRALEIGGLDARAVFEAANGQEAIAQLGHHSIDVVILDINMPVMNGLEFLERVRADQRFRSVPVVVASTEGSETRIRELLESGVQGFLRKPFQPEQIRDVLAPFVGVRDVPAVSAPAGRDAF